MRPWRELGIDLYLKYKTDVFFSTRVKIILFHIFSLAVTVVVTIGLLKYIQHITLTGVLEMFNTALSTGVKPVDPFIELNEDVESAQYFVYCSIVAISLFFGFITTHIALKPLHKLVITQKRFIASIAHELRTPLAILKTQNEVARLDVEENSPIQETLDQNVEEVDHLTEILNNLLLFNRIDNFESISFDSVDLETLIEVTISKLKMFADKKGVTLTFEKTPLPYVYGNATGLEQLFFNIIKNAINYTLRGGKVIIKSTAITEHEVTVCISDNGIGIPKNELPHIFEPFYRIDNAQKLSPGTGLGLAIVFEIIKLHSGKINVKSAVGTGTEFEISIPRHSQDMIKNRRLHEVGVIYDFSQKKEIKKT